MRGHHADMKHLPRRWQRSLDANILGEAEGTTVLAWLMAEKPATSDARYGEVFTHETGEKGRWPIWDEALIAVLSDRRMKGDHVPR